MNTTNRFVVGIDLGTTNSAVSYVDLEHTGEQKKRIRVFHVPQLTGPGEFTRLKVLPSFLYIPGKYDITREAMAAPWTIEERTRHDKNFAGAFARDHGSSTPARLVSSAKSWLCSRSADRKAPILPWGAGDDVYKVSPVRAAVSYLKHIRKSWNISMGDDDALYMENQDVIITVPASFDEVARDLTLEAAELSGLSGATLIEEPLAAFYSWLIRHEKDWSKYVTSGELILVCDVGGGTTDFTLISLTDVGNTPRFERIAVGDHLILGGDNIDIAIADEIQKKLGKSAAALDTAKWKSLCHQCRRAKEEILDGKTDETRVTVMGSGSSLIAGTISAKINRSQVEDIVLNGFLPFNDSKKINIASPGRAGFGLDYEKDTAITGHLCAFLEKHRSDVKKFIGRSVPCPDFVMFNGGSLKSTTARNRIIEAIYRHYEPEGGQKPTILENPDPDLAVARGAAYYGLVKSGEGVKVGSGSPRSYYMGVADALDDEILERGRRSVCIVERGLEEGSHVTLADTGFDVLTNRPVAIDMYSSSYRSGDKSGDIIEVDDSLTPLPPAETIIQFGKKEEQLKIPVQIEATYTETGSLEIFCRSLTTRHRWKLRFQLRGGGLQAPVKDQEIFDGELIDDVREIVKQAFSSQVDKNRLPGIVKEISNVIQRPKDKWPIGLIRPLTDELLSAVEARNISADFEHRWMNLTGFCMRPGFGEGFDQNRVKKLWKLFAKGLIHGQSPQVRSEWWIMWRRVAGGLNPGQQRQFYQSLAPLILMPAEKPRKFSPQERLEVWMAIANMEGLMVKDKIKLGNRLLSEINPKKCKPQALWSLSRIGARDLFYGSIDRVIPPKAVKPWIKTILASDFRNPKPVLTALTLLAGKTGDNLRDVDQETAGQVVKWLKNHGASDTQIKSITHIDKVEEKKHQIVFGESLPAGIIISQQLPADGAV